MDVPYARTSRATMTYHPDLGTATDLDEGDHVRLIGWLSSAHPFPVGTVPEEFVAALRAIVLRADASALALDWGFSLGVHTCELCGEFRSGGNVGVPAGELLFVAPEMVHHYVVAHRYHPPAAFVSAVLSAPLPGSDEYLAAVARFRRPHSGP